MSKALDVLRGVAVLGTPAAIYYLFIGDPRPYNPAFFEARTAILDHCMRQEWPRQEHRCVEFLQLMDSCERREACDPDETFKFLVDRGFSVPDLRLPAPVAEPSVPPTRTSDDLAPEQGLPPKGDLALKGGRPSTTGAGLFDDLIEKYSGPETSNAPRQ